MPAVFRKGTLFYLEGSLPELARLTTLPDLRVQCNTLHCAVLNALHSIEVHCIVLHCIVLHRTLLHCPAGFTWRWKVLGSRNLLTAAALIWRGEK